MDTEKVNDIQVDVTEKVTDDIQYELKIEEHPNCSGDDIIEAIETNFYGILDDRKVVKSDPIRHILVEKTDMKYEIRKIENELRNLKVFRVTVEDDEIVKDVIEGWKKVCNFDDYAFKNSDCKNIRIRVRDVQSL